VSLVTVSTKIIYHKGTKTKRKDFNYQDSKTLSFEIRNGPHFLVPWCLCGSNGL